ncbi:MAG: glycosyltransferase [Spirochaetes bacterium]|nr:glycosyltransferase [Spirochaetota bacterium]
MKKIDLHVHSKYSSHSQNPIIKALGSQESYVEPEYIYKTAIERGMDFVTITDHDTITGCLEIKQKYPDKVIMGVETTAFFPEDGCPVHILVYGFTEEQFNEFNDIRTDIYKFRDYLKSRNLAHSVAHATYRLNKKLTIKHIEKLLILFDIFEGLNGNGNRIINQNFRDVLSNLNDSDMNKIAVKYGIKPFSQDPSKKGMTAGGDDHSGLFIGSTYTLISAQTVDEISSAILNKTTQIAGRCQDHKTYAFHLFKVARDNFLNRSTAPAEGLINQIFDFIFHNTKFSLKNMYKIYRIKKSEKHFHKMVAGLLTEAEKPFSTLDEKLSALYSKITEITDEIIKAFISSVINGIEKGNLKGALNLIPKLTGVILVYTPILFAVKYMNKDFSFNKKVASHFLKNREDNKKRILWFTDTINDLNGVSVTLKNIGWLAHKRGDDIHIVSSVLEDEFDDTLPPNLINLVPMFNFKLPYYENLKVKVPSFLKMIDTLYKYQPDEIFISSPSVVGLFGLLFAKLFGIKCTTVYHTDFTMQAKNIIGEDSPLVSAIEVYTKWFHEASDKILVPSAEYIDILMKRGFDRKMMDIFHRGINTDIFKPIENSKKLVQIKYSIPEGINLLFAGRISEDKNIDFMIEAITPVMNKNKNVNLIFAGDGPYLQTLKEKYSEKANFFFLGTIPNKLLPEIYSASDLLVFPSETDTFGMVVLEALACGTPALVSQTGGPKNIVKDAETGYILDTGSLELWKEKIDEMVMHIENNSHKYLHLAHGSRKHVLENFDFEKILDNFIKTEKNSMLNQQKLHLVV